MILTPPGLRRGGLAALAALTTIAACGPARSEAPHRALRLLPLPDRFEQPVDLESPPGDPRVFVVEKTGRVRVILDGRVQPEPFLDIHDRVSSGSEQGLLGLAFHPRFRENGRVFVDYTDRNGDTRVVSYRVPPGASAVDPRSAAVVLAVPQPYPNHNGGQLIFGPDGMLYVTLGDGGSGGDPHLNGQNRGVLLGKLLRIDVDHDAPYTIPRDNPWPHAAGVRPEIWAYGLRNPWRIAFDAAAGLLYIADVGQDHWEEVDVAPLTRGGIDYGWNLREANHPFAARGPAPANLWPAAIEYSHREGCCIIGGRVYRGSVAVLRGLYFYADECGGWIETFRWRDGRAVERTRWSTGVRLTPSAFGEDARGELYVLDLGGRVYRIAGVD